MYVKVEIGKPDFSIDYESSRMTDASKDIGALVSFSGRVRANGDPKVHALEIEHYPGMTEKVIRTHIEQAAKRWPLEGVCIIHRTGYLACGEQIVLVLVASEHREDAFSAAQFLMDFLKNEAPFWKKQYDETGQSWVEVNDKDVYAKERWLD